MYAARHGFALVKGILLCPKGFDFAGPQSCRILQTVSTTHLQEGSGYPLRLCNESSTVLWPSSLPNELTVLKPTVVRLKVVKPQKLTKL